MANELLIKQLYIRYANRGYCCAKPLKENLHRVMEGIEVCVAEPERCVPQPYKALKDKDYKEMVETLEKTLVLGFIKKEE